MKYCVYPVELCISFAICIQTLNYLGLKDRNPYSLSIHQALNKHGIKYCKKLNIHNKGKVNAE